MTPVVSPRVPPGGDAAAVLAGGELRYSTVWEDHALLDAAIAPSEHDTLFVIASAGDNVLNLLLHAPRRIVAIDINPAQSALLALKVAAVQLVDHAAFLELLGLTEATGEARVATYERVRSRLSAADRAWWDGHTTLIAAGIADSGRLDRYFAGFREAHLKEGRVRSAVHALLSAHTLDAQRAAAAELFTPPFRAAFRDSFGANGLGTRGRDASQMRFVDDHLDVGAAFLARFEHACSELPIEGNFYIERFLRGSSGDAAWCPPYLRRENYDRLRALAHRVDIVTADLGEYLAGCAPRSLSHAALSDAFEYLSPEATATLINRVADAMRPGGRLAYWNLLVPRAGSALSSRVSALDELSRSLSAGDRAWFYRAFRVEEVIA